MSIGVEPNSKPDTQYVGHLSNIDSGVQHSQPVNPQQQITYIDLKYRPKVNLRNWSYLLFLTGLVLIFGYNDIIWDNYQINAGKLCCYSFAIAFFMDASYSNGKSKWKLSTDQSNSTLSVSDRLAHFDVLLGILCIIGSIVLMT